MASPGVIGVTAFIGRPAAASIRLRCLPGRRGSPPRGLSSSSARLLHCVLISVQLDFLHGSYKNGENTENASLISPGLRSSRISFLLLTGTNVKARKASYKSRPDSTGEEIDSTFQGRSSGGGSCWCPYLPTTNCIPENCNKAFPCHRFRWQREVYARGPWMHFHPIEQLVLLRALKSDSHFLPVSVGEAELYLYPFGVSSWA